MTYVCHDVRIPGAEGELGAWLFVPAHTPAPLIVMAHGFSAVKEMTLDRYASVFADAGFTVVVFDHPGFGDSSGHPRQEVDPTRQLEAYRDAITWAVDRPETDGDHVGVWGSSFAGGHALVLAATDDRVGAAVAQAPYLRPPLDEVPAELTAMLDDAGGDGSALTLPVVTRDTDGGGLLSPDPDAYDWFVAGATLAPNWRNEVTLASLVHLLRYRPIDAASAVHAPVLLLPARDDVLAPVDVAREVRALLPDTCDLIEVPGGHFDVYGKYFGLTSEAATGWFTRWLGRSG